jgi:phosphomannomutase
MSINLSSFTPYDLRAKLGEQLNEEVAQAIGYAYAKVTKAKSVCVGGDIRLSSESLKNALAIGLSQAGCRVIDLGLTGTEEMYFATVHYKLDGGIQVTASHNPKNYNGMKFVAKNATPIGRENGLEEIRLFAENILNNRQTSLPHKNLGPIEKHSCLEHYIKHLFTFIDLTKLRPMRLLMNAGNGAAGHVIDAIEQHFQDRDIPIYLKK